MGSHMRCTFRFPRFPYFFTQREPAGSAVNTSLHGSEGHKFMNNWTNTKEIIP